MHGGAHCRCIGCPSLVCTTFASQHSLECPPKLHTTRTVNDWIDGTEMKAGEIEEQESRTNSNESALFAEPMISTKNGKLPINKHHRLAKHQVPKMTNKNVLLLLLFY